MSDIVILASRILMAVFIVYGSLKFMDVSSIINNPGTKRFMDLVASGAAAPTWLVSDCGARAVRQLGDPDRWVACALVAWVVIATALSHPFWTMEGTARAANQANFYKNLAIMAAYLLLAITGAGRYSLDHRAASAPSKAAGGIGLGAPASSTSHCRAMTKSVGCLSPRRCLRWPDSRGRKSPETCRSMSGIDSNWSSTCLHALQ
jgi:putative oxidoreductase